VRGVLRTIFLKNEAQFFFSGNKRHFHSSSRLLNEQLIKVEKQDFGIAIMKFNRPEHLNALTIDMGESFTAEIMKLKEDPKLRVVVLSGEGRAFSAGGDLEFIDQRAKSKPYENSNTMLKFYQRYLNIRQLQFPQLQRLMVQRLVLVVVLL